MIGAVGVWPTRLTDLGEKLFLGRARHSQVWCVCSLCHRTWISANQDHQPRRKGRSFAGFPVDLIFVSEHSAGIKVGGPIVAGKNQPDFLWICFFSFPTFKKK